MKTIKTHLIILLVGLLGSSAASFAQQTHSAKSNFFELDLRSSTEPGTWYAGAADIGDGWLYYDWFKGFKVSAGGDWIFHARLGWLYSVGESVDGLFFWDSALQRWHWTNENAYPWLYMYGGDDEDWYFFFEGGQPGSRFFKRGSTGQTVAEADLSL